MVQSDFDKFNDGVKALGSLIELLKHLFVLAVVVSTVVTTFFYYVLPKATFAVLVAMLLLGHAKKIIEVVYLAGYMIALCIAFEVVPFVMNLITQGASYIVGFLFSFVTTHYWVALFVIVLLKAAQMQKDSGYTVLHFVAIVNQYKLIEPIQLYLKADINATDWHGNTPLHYACKFQHQQTIRTLLLRGSQPKKNKDSLYPLDLCAPSTKSFYLAVSQAT